MRHLRMSSSHHNSPFHPMQLAFWRNYSLCDGLCAARIRPLCSPWRVSRHAPTARSRPLSAIRGAGIVWRSLWRVSRHAPTARWCPLSAIRGRTIAQYQHYALLATAVHHLSMACQNTCQIKCRFTHSLLMRSE